jgi:PmbA protein
MEQEKYYVKSTSLSVNIANSEVNSLRINEDLQTIVRVFDDGKIGIAGQIGECDEQKLIESAKEKLNQGIAYPCNLTAGKVRKADTTKQIIKEDEFVSTIKHLVARLAKEYPQFIFSNKANMEITEEGYSNSLKTEYVYKGNDLVLSLIIKDKASSNIFDLGYGISTNEYDEDKIVADIGKLIKPFFTVVDMPENVPVIIEASSVAWQGVTGFIAEAYASGASLYNGKLGKKIFDERVNILFDKTKENAINTPFFDVEGSTVEGDKFYIVKDGVFNGIITTKRTSAQYNYAISGSAGCNYDSVPAVSLRGLDIAETDKLENIVKGKAIFVSMTSGGDITPSGDIGLPVMLAYLYDNGNLVGKLPPFSINGNIFNLLGKDMLGIAKGGMFEFDTTTKYLIAKFSINKS